MASTDKNPETNLLEKSTLVPEGADPQPHDAKMTLVLINEDSQRPIENDGIQRVRNVQLLRESRGCFSVVFYSSIFIFLDVLRVVSSYGMKYYNGDTYPIPQTELVVLSELGKLVLFFGKMSFDRSICDVTISLCYLIPSVGYAINNNIYFFALHYTTPPMWNILMQLRVVFTGLVYRFFFKKTFTAVQWSGLVLLIAAIVLAKFSGDHTTTDKNAQSNMLIALLLALIGSLIAAAGPIYTEYLLKNDDRPFDEKQLQLYMFGSICAGILFFAETQTTENKAKLTGPESLVTFLVVVCILFSIACGISTAFIMKKLDNIVKLYAQALSNIVTAIACVIFFPKQFTFDVAFLVSLFLTILAIFMYENENLDVSSIRPKINQVIEFFSKSTIRMTLLLIGCSLLLLLIAVFYRLQFLQIVIDMRSPTFWTNNTVNVSQRLSKSAVFVST